MNKATIALLTRICSGRLDFQNLIKGFHSCMSTMHNKHQLPNYFGNRNIESSLWFTNLPSRKKRALTLNERKKFKKKVSLPLMSGPLMIDCKNPKLNHYRGVQYRKFDIIPLASKGWHHRKSKGDYFTIMPITEHPAFLSSSNESLAYAFEDMPLSSVVREQIKKLGIKYPTVIQSKSIPEVLQGNSVLITAETGCGKTLAYLAPILDNVLKLKHKVCGHLCAPFAVIVLPTRELAIQVGMIAHKLCSDLKLNSLILLGGKTKRMLLNPSLEVADILVCTPGILSKMLTHKMLSLQLCKHLVLDEADTLLDDSFNEKIKSILRKSMLQFGHMSKSPEKTQLCLVSATMPSSIDIILENIISRENLVEISSHYLHRIQPHICQKFVRVGKSNKAEELLKIIRQNVVKKVPTMIFCNKTDTSNWLNLFLNENGIDSIRVNAAMKHEERLEQYQKFRDGLVDVITCTDIASRGVDSTRVKHVINYEFPKFVADYIHRCGRTGRIGHDEGCLITNFISSSKELPLVQSIEKSVRTYAALENVNNNISKILKEKALSNILENEKKKKNVPVPLTPAL